MNLTANDKSNRYLVPHYMKTKRFAPRVLATLLCLSCTIAVLWGSQALARMYTAQNSTPWDELSPGTTSYKLYESSDPTGCLGYFETELIPKASAEADSSLKVSSVFGVGSAEKRYTVTMNAESRFDHLGELMTASVRFSLDELGYLQLASTVHGEPVVATLRATNGRTESVSLFTLDPVYLFEPQKDRYRLRLPTSFQNLTTAVPLRRSTSLDYKKIDAEERTKCENTLEQKGAKVLLQTPEAASELFEASFFTILQQLKQRGRNDQS